MDFFGSGAHSKSVKTFLFFLRSPNFGQKNPLNFGEDLFFADHLHSAGKKT